MLGGAFLFECLPLRGSVPPCFISSKVSTFECSALGQGDLGVGSSTKLRGPCMCQKMKNAVLFRNLAELFSVEGWPSLKDIPTVGL